MTMISEIVAVTAMNLRAIPQRLGTSLVIVVGIAGVVGVLISVLAMGVGFIDAVNHTGRADRAIVLRGGSDAELASTLSRDATLTILDGPGVKHDAAGKSIGSADVVAIVELQTKAKSPANVTLRGVGPESGELRPELRIVEGRMFQPALREVIVGRSAQAQFAGLNLGDHLDLRDAQWTVVGIFDTGGDSHESELMADADTVLSSLRRNLFQSVTVMLDSPAAFDGFAAALKSNPQLTVDVEREPDYFAHLSAQLGKIMNYLGYGVGGIMAVGALFGALNTMYSAVSARSREIATLRAIGFGGTPVVISVFVEALTLSLIGGVVGAALAWAFFNGNVVNTLSGNFTQVVFKLSVTPGLITLGILWALVIGAIGGLFPAIRAARLPVAAALRTV
jgi:putative ABC transport system permease protein